MQAQSTHGIVDHKSQQSVDDTLGKLEQLLQSKGVKLFAVIDHSGEAAKAGLQMPPTKLAIFGNPKGGTPLMLAAPRAALDLPLKILIWEDAHGAVWISHNSTDYIATRYGLPEALAKNIDVVHAFAQAISE